ncbi:MAG TPA: Ig-like domain-containing protein, partial [Phycisphaerae bacterium]|nr:Ig-like domain-containing protein [Phycisphaerae bacterium]
VNSAFFQARTSVGASTGYASVGCTAPYYVRVVRSGGSFSGYLSATGAAGTWSYIGSASVSAMASGTIYVGLAATSQLPGTLGEFVMDNVRVIESGAPANTAPIAAGDSYYAAWNSALNVLPGAGVLANDSDANADSLSAALVGNVSSGTLTLRGNGSFDYAPNANFVGTDSFTYRAGDGSLSSGTTTVTIRVAVPGDYDGNNYVDQTDYLVWANRYGDSVAQPYDGADGNGNGVLDQTDYLVWANHYGEGTPPGGGSSQPVAQMAATLQATGGAAAGSSSLATGASVSEPTRQTAGASEPAGGQSGDMLSALAARSADTGQASLGGTRGRSNNSRENAAASAPQLQPDDQAGPPATPTDHLPDDAGTSAPVILSATGTRDGQASLQVKLDSGLVDVLGDPQVKALLVI